MKPLDQKPLLIDRKEVAHICSITVNQVARNEKSLGLLPHKVLVNKRVIRYRMTGVLSMLKIQAL